MNTKAPEKKAYWQVKILDATTDKVLADFTEGYYGTLDNVRKEIDKMMTDWYGDFTFAGSDGDVYYELARTTKKNLAIHNVEVVKC